jgi:hypothetical protein
LDGPLSKLCPAVALSRQDGRHSAVALLLKAALIQVSDYRFLGASGIYVSSEGRVGCEFIHPAQPTDVPSSRRSSLSHFYTPGLTPFRGLEPLGQRNLMPILPLAHPLGVGSLNGNNKIYLYKFLKQNENEMEYYLSHPDRNVRLILTKFRLSEHKLLIEIGRNLKIPRDQRLCAICNVLEDEFHFFIECKRNINNRNILYQYFKNIYSNLN